MPRKKKTHFVPSMYIGNIPSLGTNGRVRSPEEIAAETERTEKAVEEAIAQELESLGQCNCDCNCNCNCDCQCDCYSSSSCRKNPNDEWSDD